MTVIVNNSYIVNCFLFSSPELAWYHSKCFTLSWIDLSDSRWPQLSFFSVYLSVHISPVILKMNKFTTGFGNLDVGDK